MQKYLLCELDDESYAHPRFGFYDSFNSAQKEAIESIIYIFNYAEGYNLQLKTEDPESEKDIIDSVRISANWGKIEKIFMLLSSFRLMKAREHICWYGIMLMKVLDLRFFCKEHMKNVLQREESK